MWKRIFLVLLLASAAGACSTASLMSRRYPLPSCDGGDRRPLNRDKWDHEKRADLGAAAKPCGRA